MADPAFHTMLDPGQEPDADVVINETSFTFTNLSKLTQFGDMTLVCQE